MKNNFFILGAFLCTALFVTSCTDDNKDDDENEGKASIIVGINMQPQADMGYIVPIQDMKAGTMSFANAVARLRRQECKGCLRSPACRLPHLPRRSQFHQRGTILVQCGQ